MIAWVRIRLSVMGMEVVGTVSTGNWETRNLLQSSVEGAR